MSPVCVPEKTNPRGFTLIELLVVIFIISILIAATLTIIPKVRRAVQGAQTSAQLAAIASAIQQYYNDYRSYPGPIANNQLYTTVDSSPMANEPGLNGPLVGETGSSGTNTMASSADASKLDATKVTSSENLVLGLLGGLRVDPNVSTNQLEYHPEDLFALDGVTPVPHGPASLNPANPRRQQAYLSVRLGEISTPSAAFNTAAGGSFADSAGRSPKDTLIPVFLDKYSEPLPILYFRTNIGGTSIAGFRSSQSPLPAATPNGSPLQDQNGNNVTAPAQYDLSQNIAYTGLSGSATIVSTIGLVGNTDMAPTKNPNSLHGLQGLGNANLTDPIDTNVVGTYVPAGPSSGGFTPGSNALAYFKDPSLNTTTSTNTYQGVARQKDGFLLISAGPDRQYGTRDDIIYPGPLQP